ncbi:MAG: HAMP domain-containing histidine kinase [Planctomycetes bacterium]|nr:HAMP domain-containing histidine kinase [Planctomycetota bacterium]
MKAHTRSSLLITAVAALYGLGILAPAAVLGAILVTSLERERATEREKRQLERRDAGELVNEAVEREIAALRERPAEPAAEVAAAVRYFWPAPPPDEGLIRITRDGVLPFERTVPGVVETGDRLILESPEFLAGRQAEDRGELAVAAARYRRALAEEPSAPLVVRVALARVELAAGEAGAAREALAGADLEDPSAPVAVAIHARRILAEALARTGDSERAAELRRAARRELDAARERLGYLQYCALAGGGAAAPDDDRPAWLAGVDALYRALAGSRESLARGEALVHPGPGGEAELICAGPGEPGLPGGRPLRFTTVTALMQRARQGRLDADLARRGFVLQEEAAGANAGPVRVAALDRTFGLVDREPVAATLREDDDARTLLLLGALAYAGLVMGLVLTLRAVRKQQRLARLRADFISSVSHELKTPVTSLMLFSDLLRAGAVTDPGKVREYYDFLGEEAGKLAHLVNNVLDFARLEAGRRTYEREPLDVGEVVRRIAAVFAARAEAAGTRIDVASADGELRVSADRDALERVLANLLDNAIKYAARAGPVRVTAGRAGDAVRISVADRGPGIPAAERARLFGRFQRGEHHGPDAPAGSGLGLAIAAELVRAHRGTIRIEDTSGGGATFVVELPAAGQGP